MAKPKLLTRMYLILFATNFLFFLGFYMLVPTLPLYGEMLGGTKAEIGLIATAFSIASVAVRFTVSFLMDHFGRKSLLRFGILLAFVFTFGYLLVHSVYSVMLLRIFQGFGFGMVTTFCGAMAADIVPDERRGEGIGYFSMGTTGAIAFSPTIGLAFVNHSGFPAMFIASGVALAAALVVMQFIKVPDPPKAKKTDEAGNPLPRPAWWNRFFDPVITWQFCLLFIYGLCRGAEQNFIPLLANSEGLSALSYFYVIQTIVVFAFKFITSRTYDKQGPIFSAVLGGACIVVSMFLLSITHDNLTLTLAGIVGGVGLGTLVPTYQVWIMTTMGAEKRTLGSALYYNTYDIGIAIGSVVTGAIAGHLGYHHMFRICMFAMIFYLILCFVTKKVKHIKKPGRA